MSIADIISEDIVFEVTHPNIFFAIATICTSNFTPAPMIEMMNHNGTNNTLPANFKITISILLFYQPRHIMIYLCPVISVYR